MSQEPKTTLVPHGRGSPLDETERGALASLVAVLGERETTRFLGLTRHTLARALGGLGIYPPTAFLIRRRLSEDAEARSVAADATQSHTDHQD
jgi:hypothetical protein